MKKNSGEPCRLDLLVSWFNDRYKYHNCLIYEAIPPGIRLSMLRFFCMMMGHNVVDPTKHAYPGYVFCFRCKSHIRW